MYIYINGEGNGNPFQYSHLEKSHGQRSLEGYSPWGPKGQAQLSKQYICVCVYIYIHCDLLVSGNI